MDKSRIRRERLQQLIKDDFHDNVAEFVRRVNEGPTRRERPMQASYIHRIFTTDVKHRKNIGEDLARELELAASKDEGWLDRMDRVSQPLSAYVVIPGGGDPAEGSYVEVRRMTVRGSCGGGRLNGNPTEVRPVAFRRDWLAEKGVKPEDALVIEADGDSMNDFIVDGDMVIFNTRKTDLRSGSIFAIEHPDGTKIKRVFLEADRALVLRSDNQDKRKFPDERISPEHRDQVRVLGEFVWRGGG